MSKQRITDTSEKPIDFSKYDIKHDLTGIHFSQAIFCLGKSTQSKHPVENTPFVISSVIHSYFTIESAINLVTDDIMFNEKSQLFIKKEDRPIELRKFFSNWRNIFFEDKLTFLIERFTLSEISKELIEEIKELNRLRNLIVHNKIYRAFYSQPEIEENPRIWEVEYELNTKEIFPKTKFNLPKDSNVLDSYKAFRICLKLLIIFSNKFPIGILYHFPSGDLGCIDKTKTLDEHEKDILQKIKFEELL